MTQTPVMIWRDGRRRGQGKQGRETCLFATVCVCSLEISGTVTNSTVRVGRGSTTSLHREVTYSATSGSFTSISSISTFQVRKSFQIAVA